MQSDENFPLAQQDPGRSSSYFFGLQDYWKGESFNPSIGGGGRGLIKGWFGVQAS